MLGTQNASISPLKSQLLQLTDPRLKRKRKHELIDVLMIAVTALLCGAENFTHMAQFGKAKESWLRTFLTLSNGIPSHDTFRRVFMLLSPEKFSSVFLSWTQSLRQAVGAEVVALDGKTVRRSFDSAKGQSAIHLVSVWASTNRLVIGQIKVDDKSNEITAVNEEQCRARTGHAAENFGLLRRMVLNQLRRDSRCQTGIKGKQLNASWDHAYLQSFLDF